MRSGRVEMDVDERERRLAQNEALFREVNERVETLADQLGPDVPYEFLCECANADCTFRISLPLSVYERSGQTPSSSSSYPCITRRKSRIWSSRKALTGSSAKRVRPANTSSSSIHAAGRHVLSGDIQSGDTSPSPPRLLVGWPFGPSRGGRRW